MRAVLHGRLREDFRGDSRLDGSSVDESQIERSALRPAVLAEERRYLLRQRLRGSRWGVVKGPYQTDGAFECRRSQMEDLHAAVVRRDNARHDRRSKVRRHKGEDATHLGSVEGDRHRNAGTRKSVKGG